LPLTMDLHVLQAKHSLTAVWLWLHQSR
jgi:hypothetical protein